MEKPNATVIPDTITAGETITLTGDSIHSTRQGKYIVFRPYFSGYSGNESNKNGVYQEVTRKNEISVSFQVPDEIPEVVGDLVTIFTQNASGDQFRLGTVKYNK